jgi:hypothetical protein
MKFILMALTISFTATAGFASGGPQVPLKFLQIKCTSNDGKTVAAIGNDSAASATTTEAILYTKGPNKEFTPGATEKAEIAYSKEGMNTAISVKSETVDIEVTVFEHPFEWSDGTVNGKESQCVIDPIYFDTVPFAG